MISVPRSPSAFGHQSSFPKVEGGRIHRYLPTLQWTRLYGRHTSPGGQFHPTQISVVTVSTDRAPSSFDRVAQRAQIQTVEKQDADLGLAENSHPRLTRHLIENGTEAVSLFVPIMEGTKLAVSIHPECISHFHWILNLVIAYG